MSAYGSLGYEDLPMYSLGAGIRSDYGAMIPPGGRVYYVRNPVNVNGDSEDVASRCISSLNGALTQCRPNGGDTIFVLPGHTETIPIGEYLTNLVPGVTVIGLGNGNARPTFTWAGATSTWGIDLPNVSIRNCVLNLDPGAGTVTVANPITISAPGCSLLGCKIRAGSSATCKVGTAIAALAGSTDLSLFGNDVWGATAAECVALVSFNASHNLRFMGNSLVGATSSAAAGVMQFTGAASTFIKVRDCQLRNNKALSSVVVTGLAGVSGEVDNVFMTGLSDAGLTSFWSVPASLTFGAQVYVANTIGERAALFGTASA